MIKQFFIGFLFGVILYFAMLLANSAEAADWHLIELHDVTVTGKKFFPKGRNPLINGNQLPNREPAEEVDLNLNMDVAGVAYWENMVHSMTDNDTTTGKGQFRVVGLNFRWGVHVTDRLDVQYEHYSKHVLDTTFAPGFPVEDSVGVRFRVFDLGTPKGSVF